MADWLQNGFQAYADHTAMGLQYVTDLTVQESIILLQVFTKLTSTIQAIISLLSIERGRREEKLHNHKKKQLQHFYAPSAFGLSIHLSIRRYTRLRFLSKVESQDLINGSKLIFHGPLTLDFGRIIMVKIFVQGRILSSTNGIKLIFHMRMYRYETSRNIQEPWPHDLYFKVC